MNIIFLKSQTPFSDNVTCCEPSRYAEGSFYECLFLFVFDYLLKDLSQKLPSPQLTEDQ